VVNERTINKRKSRESNHNYIAPPITTSSCLHTAKRNNKQDLPFVVIVKSSPLYAQCCVRPRVKFPNEARTGRSPALRKHASSNNRNTEDIVQQALKSQECPSVRVTLYLIVFSKLHLTQSNVFIKVEGCAILKVMIQKDWE
jgi:hypothetical protein